MNSDRQSKVFATLQDISQKQEHLRVGGSADLERLRCELLNELTGSRKKVDLSGVVQRIDLLNREARERRTCIALLDSLRYRAIRTRQSRIAAAHSRTFEWALAEDQPEHSPRHELVSWLRADSGIFWITGKAGSGKSTLMKYLLSQTGLTALLEGWAGPKHLTIGSFFFWAAGTKLQKSQEGLMRSLLFEVLRQRPEYISFLLFNRWSRTSDELETKLAWTWERDELFECLKALTHTRLCHERLVFFIDGLDEYDGDHADLLEVLQVLDRASNIKLCVSSRPRNIFERAFGDRPNRNLVLQRFTRNDINLYVAEKLEKQPRFQSSQTSEEMTTRLADIVVERAQGVFLWVFLVVKSLIRGLTNADSMSELEQRLYDMPKDLEEYFQQMLDSIEKVYHADSARMLLACIAAAEPLPLGVVDLMDGRYTNACDEVLNSCDVRNQDTGCMIARVSARCTDLIEVVPNEDDIYSFEGYRLPVQQYNVEFLHRTARDFLGTRELNDSLRGRLQGDFDEYFALSRAFLLLMCQLQAPSKVWPTHSRLLDSLMFYAKEYEQVREAADLPLIEALEYSFRMQSDNRMQVLELITKWGLTHSASIHLRQNERSDKQILRALLSYSLHNPRNIIGEPGSPCFVEPRMVSLLVGLYCATGEGFSRHEDIWKDFVHSCYLKEKTSGLENLDRIHRVFACLISHGADCQAKITTGTRTESYSSPAGGVYGNSYSVVPVRSRIEKVIDDIFSGRQGEDLQALIRQYKHPSWYLLYLPKYLRGRLVPGSIVSIS